MFTVYLDGNQLEDHPRGVEDFEAQIAKNIDRRDVVTTFPLELEFIGDGYRYIKEQKDKNGYCTLIDFKAEVLCGGQVMRTLLGVLFVSDVQFDLEHCFANVVVKDDSFESYINNNKSVKVNIGAWKTKSGEFLQGADLLSLQMFNPSTGTFDSGGGGAGFTFSGVRISYDLKVAWTHQIQYLSDKKIKGVKSDWYDNLKAGEQIAVCSGRELRQGSAIDERPNVSFGDLFLEVAKLFNLQMGIEIDSNKDIWVRIDTEDYFKNLDTLFVLDNIKNVKESILQDLLYAVIKFGDQNAEKELAPDANEFGYVNFFSHVEEEYHTDNQCNIDNTLDLTTNELVIDHNAIKRALFDADDSLDEKTFLIQYNSANSKASNGDPLKASQRVYNPQMLNNKVAERYNLQGAVAKFLGDSNDNSNARRATVYSVTHSHLPQVIFTTTNPFPFNNEISDPNNNYNPATYRYTSPTGGVYGFQVFMNWEIVTVNPDATSFIQITLERYDVGNTLLESFSKISEVKVGATQLPFTSTLNFFQSMYLAATDYVQVRIVTVSSSQTAHDVKFIFQDNSQFACVSSQNGGGVYEEKEAGDYNISIFDLEKALTGEQINLMLDNPHKPIEFNMDGENNTKIWPFNHKMRFFDGKSILRGINAPNDNN